MSDEARQIDTILTFLGAYAPGLVKEALKQRNRHLRGDRMAQGWQPYPGEADPDPDRYRLMDRMQIEGRWYIRERPPASPEAPAKVSRPANAQPATQDPQPKTDLTPRRTNSHCPLCGEEMIFEPICGGCALGRMGFRGRYICMDNDVDHQFYVTRPGVELANR